MTDPAEAHPRSGVPQAIVAVAGGRPARVVWENRLGGLTCEVGTGAGRCFVKWAPTASGIDLGAEASRLSWALPFTPVPQPISEGNDSTGSWLVTAALSGQNAVASRWKAEPQTAVRAIGEGLRAMHESLPVNSCPFSWAAEDRLADIRRQINEGSLDSTWWPSAEQPLATGRALELLADIPPTDQLVVCHGDSCAPNTMLTDDGHWSAHVDLGQLGVADRWADLAIATWSAGLNYGPGWEDMLLAAYGIPRDVERTRYYRLLGRCY